MAVSGFRGSHDLQLDSDDTASPTTSLSLVLALDEQGRRRYRQFRLPLFPERRSQGPIRFSDKDPVRDLIFSQNDWSGGGFAPIYKDSEPNRYAQADGCDMRWEGVATLGMAKSEKIYLLGRNWDAEDTSAGSDDWTNENGAHSQVTTPVHAGSRAWSVSSSTSGGVGGAYQAIGATAALRGNSVKFGGMIRKNTCERIRLRIADDSSETATSWVTSSDYSDVAVTHTVAAGAAHVRCYIDVDNNSGQNNQTGLADSMFIMAGVGDRTCRGYAVVSDKLYRALGRWVQRWDETNDYWETVYVNAGSEASDIIEFDNNIFVAFGGQSGDNAYIYGEDVSWTTSNLGGDAKYAYHFAVGRNITGTGATGTDAVLWKSRQDGTADFNFVAASTNPINGGSWSSEYVIGSGDRDITKIYTFQDSLIVGKEDGLHMYRRFYNDGGAADVFENLTNEFEADINLENFSNGQDWHGRLFLVASKQSLFYFDGSKLVDIAGLFFAPRLRDFGGRIRAFAADPIQLWAHMDVPTADTTITKETHLISLRLGANGLWMPHIIEKVEIGIPEEMVVYNGYLRASGEIYNDDDNNYETAEYRWTLPTRTVAPAFDLSAAINTGGNFETSWWDGNLPDDDKAFISLTVLTKPSTMDAEHTIIVSFRVDEAASYTTLGTFSGTGAVQTLYFDTIATPESKAIGKRIQLKFAFASDDSVSPEMYSFSLHATLRPQRVRMWEFYVQIGQNIMMRGGGRDPTTKALQISNLETLEDQVYPIELTEDLDADGTATSYRVQIIRDSIARVPEEEREQGTEIWRFICQEVPLSA